MVLALGPGPSVPKRELGAESGHRCRREEEGGDGKPDSGHLRQASASSPETAANSAVELPGPRPAAGTRPCPTSRASAGAVGRRRARVGTVGGNVDCESVLRPAFPYAFPNSGPVARGGAKRGGLLRRDWVEECWGKRWMFDLEFTKGSGTCVVPVDVLVHLFIHPSFPPRPPFFLSICFSCFTVKA